MTNESKRATDSDEQSGATAVHPEYLDDDGWGTRCFLRLNLAATRGEAEKIVEHMGFEWDWPVAEKDIVWLAPAGERGGEDYYDLADETAPDAVMYWRWRW